MKLLYYNLDISQKHYFVFHTVILLDIELKKNVCKAYVRSLYVLFPGGCEGVTKLVLMTCVDLCNISNGAFSAKIAKT